MSEKGLSLFKRSEGDPKKSHLHHHQIFALGFGIRNKGRWAELPADLVEDVSRRLPVLSFISMANVCKPWRRILTEQQQLRSRRQGLPWLVLTGHNQYDERPCFNILQRNICSLHIPAGNYCWGSVQDWLILVDKRESTLHIHFWNPFTATKIVLPTLSNVYDWYAKIILSEASPDHPNCLFLMLGIHDRRIACWTPGVGSSSWRFKPDDQRAVPFSDAVFCNGRFYFVTHDYNIQTLDPQDVISAMKQPYNFRTCDIIELYFRTCDIKLSSRTCDMELHFRSHPVSFPDTPYWPSKPQRLYLVESCGEVLMVCRLFLSLSGTHRETHSFEVFKLDARHPMVWTKMQSLGDRVLFLGKSDSRSFSAKDLGDDVANRIFFLNDFFTFGENEWNSSVHDTIFPPMRRSTFMDWGSFSMETKCFVPKGRNRGSRYNYPPIWITVPVWWFFTLSSTAKHQRAIVSKRTRKSVKPPVQQEKKKASCRQEKRRRIASIY